MTTTHTVRAFVSLEHDPADVAAIIDIPVVFQRNTWGVSLHPDHATIDGKQLNAADENCMLRYLIGEAVDIWRASPAGVRAERDFMMGEPAERAARIADMRAAAD